MTKTPMTASSSSIGRGALLACAALTVMSGTALAPALPSIRRAFAGGSDVEWTVRLVVTMPALAIALAAPWTGGLADRVGRRRALVGFLLLYAASGTSALVAGELWEIVAGRAILGASAAGIMTASTAIATEWLAPPARARFLARQASVMSLAGVASVAVGGVLAAEHWRAPFAMYLVAAPIAALVLGGVDASPASIARAAAAPATVTHAPVSAVAAARGSVAPATSIEAVDTGADRFSRRVRIGAYVLAIVAMAFVFMVPLQVPFLVSAEGPRKVGVAVATSSLFAAASSLLFGRLQPSEASVVAWTARSFVLMGVGYLVVGVLGGWSATVVGVAIAGVGSGWIMPNLSRSVVASSSAHRRGAAIGALTSSVYAGQFLSPAVSIALGARRSIPLAFVLSGGALFVFAAVLACATHVGVTPPRRRTR